MRIAHITNTFSNLSETFLYDLIKAQHGKENSCYIFTFNRDNYKKRPFPSNNIYIIKRRKLDIRRYWNFFVAFCRNKNRQTANWKLYRKQLKKELQLVAPDVIHAHFGDMGVLVEPIADELNIPLIVTFHGYDISILPKEKYWFNNYQNLFKTASALVGVSNHVCKKIDKNGADLHKITMIHNGIDTTKFSPKLSGSSDNKNIIFTFIGRFVPKKAPIILLKSYNYFLKKYGIENVELYMVGDGPLFDQAKKFARDNVGEEYINFFGNVEHAKISSILHSTDVYLQHSVEAETGDEEGMGVTLAEASASAIPVIATRHNGFPDVVLDNKTGYLVAEGDFKAMGEKMNTLYKKPKLRQTMGQEGRKHIEKRFEKEQQTNKIIELYQRCSAD